MSQWAVNYPINYAADGDKTNEAIYKHIQELSRLYSLIGLLRTNFMGASEPDAPEVNQLYINPVNFLGRVYGSDKAWHNLLAFPMRHDLDLHNAGTMAQLQALITDKKIVFLSAAPTTADSGKELKVGSDGVIALTSPASSYTPSVHDYTKHSAMTMAQLQSLVSDKKLVFLAALPTAADSAKIVSIDSTGAFVLTNPAAQTDALNAPYEKVKNWGTLSAATTLAASDGNIHTFTVGAAITLTLNANCLTGFCRTLTLVITNGGAFTVTWPASVKWAGGSAPTFSAAGIDVVTLLTVDGGSTWLGSANGVSYA